MTSASVVGARVIYIGVGSAYQGARGGRIPLCYRGTEDPSDSESERVYTEEM
jgi:hypothetical protein